MTIEDQIRDFAKSGLKSTEFTKEGLLLGIFKMTLQNNAMLNTLISMVSKVYIEMPANPNLETKAEAFEEIRKEFENANKSMSLLFEQVSTKIAYDFAVDHDSNLDVMGNCKKPTP